MKTAKKVLSVVLSVMLIVGTISFAVSAAIPLEAGQSINCSLRAEVFDTDGSAAAEIKESGSELAWVKDPATDAQQDDITAYEEELAAGEYCEDDVIEVKAGQVVWITVWLTTEGEVFPGKINTTVLYSNGMFLSCNDGMYNTVVPYDAGSLYARKVKGDVIGGTTGTALDSLRASAPALTEEQAQTWHYAAQIYDMTPTSTSAIPADVDEPIGSFPLWIDPDVAPGTVGYVRFGGLDGLGKIPVISCYPDGDMSLTTTQPVANRPEDYTFDGGILTFKVAGEAEEDEFDYRPLDAPIAAYEEAELAGGEDLYTEETWTAATELYEQAVALKASQDAADQDEIDNLAAALQEAVDNLEEMEVLDFSRLDNDVDTLIPELLEDAYTTSSYADYADCMATAQDVQINATTQDEIDAAADALEEAFAALTIKADTSALEDAIAQAEAADTGDWTADSRKALDDAVAEGQGLMANADDLSDQNAVDRATQAILDALEGEIAYADYTDVDAAVAAAAKVNRDNYTAASLKVLDDAVAAVERDLPASQQTAVDAMAEAINDAIDALKELADTSRLERAIADADAANETDYAADIWAAIEEKVADGNTYIGAGLAADDVQGDIDALTDEINDLLTQMLGDADYSAVDAAINNMPDDFSNYTDDSTQAVIDAYDAIVRGLKEDKQGDVDKMADDLAAAINGLTLKGADYEYVDKYVAQAANVDKALYTDDSLAALDAALAAVVRGLDITHQDEVTNMANDLFVALDGLELKDADYSAVETAIAKYPADTSIYTEESIAALDKAIGDVVYDLKADEQDAVDAMAQAIEDAIAALKKLGADYSDVDAAIAKADGLTQKNYVDFSGVTAAIDAVVRDLPVDQQDDIDAMAQAIYDAIDALVMKDANYKKIDALDDEFAKRNPDEYTTATWEAYQAAHDAVEHGLKIDRQADVDAWFNDYYAARNALQKAGPADYSAVDAAIARADGIDADNYTNFRTVEDAIANITTGLNENHQDEVDAMAQAINDAIDALEKQPANYDELDAAIAESEDILDEIKDIEDWYINLDAFKDALADAKAVARDLKFDEQDTIDEALEALKTAEANVELKPADYTALDEAIAAAADVQKDLYTEESVAVFEAALADAQAVEKDLLIDNQADIDAAAQALKDAQTALELKPTEPEEPTGFVSKAATTDGNSTPLGATQFSATVDTLAWKIQTVDEAGNTITFARNDSRVSIETFKADGTPTEYLDKDAAYEVWTVDQYLPEGDYTVISKDQAGNWEDVENGCTLEVKASRENINVISITPAANEAVRYEKFDVQVVTGSDVLKVQIQYNGVAYKTFAPSSTDENGNNVFDCFVASGDLGDVTIDVRYKTADGWFDCTDPVATVSVYKTADSLK